MQNKQHMIEMIRQRNRSASADYLVHFDEQALEQYLRRLDFLDRRGRDSVWVRESQARAVSTRQPV